MSSLLAVVALALPQASSPASLPPSPLHPPWSHGGGWPDGHLPPTSNLQEQEPRAKSRISHATTNTNLKGNREASLGAR
eukprot:scaffold173037_cov30-Tisochrysis_lutea.AAC.1